MKRQTQRDLKAAWRYLCSTRPEEQNLVHDNARTADRASPRVTCPVQKRLRVRCCLTSEGETFRRTDIWTDVCLPGPSAGCWPTATKGFLCFDFSSLLRQFVHHCLPFQIYNGVDLSHGKEESPMHTTQPTQSLPCEGWRGGSVLPAQWTEFDTQNSRERGQ